VIDNDNTAKEWRKNIIQSIIVARTSKGWTQSDLAIKLGAHRSSVARLESGEHNPTLNFLLRVASILDMEIDLKPSQPEIRKPANNTYEIRLYDVTLLTFTLEERGIEGLQASIQSINDKQKILLPLGMPLTNDGVLKWLERRVIPKSRAFVGEILKTLGLSAGDTKGIIDICKGLSLNDSY
jgi:transcriptional regulator with XRE-family HTH domain